MEGRPGHSEKDEQNLLERADMKMLSLMVGTKRIENMMNEEIRAMAGVPNISETIREARLRWLGHVETQRLKKML